MAFISLATMTPKLNIIIIIIIIRYRLLFRGGECWGKWREVIFKFS